MFTKKPALPRLLSIEDAESRLQKERGGVDVKKLDSYEFKSFLEKLFMIELFRAGIYEFEFEKRINLSGGSFHREIDFYFPEAIDVFFVKGPVQNIEIKYSECDKARMRDQHAQLAEVGYPTVIFDELDIICCQHWGLDGLRTDEEFYYDIKKPCTDGTCYLCKRYKKRQKKWAKRTGNR